MLKNSIEILKKIENEGYKAYLVGGFVRDYIMKKDSYDIDICTNAKPKELIKIFEDAILPKERYGAVTLYYKNIRYEITTFREELKYLDRRPVEMEYIDDLRKDIERRDFTINSICMDSNEKIMDFFEGIKDINKKIIRSLGDPDIKFKEDPLRMLRAIRFATVLNFKLDKCVINAIKNNSYLLKEISYERKKSELTKIFVSNNSKYGIKIISRLNLEKDLDIKKVNKLKVTSDIMGIWSELNVLEKYPFTKLEKDVIKSINEIVEKKKVGIDELYKYGLYNCVIAAEILGISKKTIVNLDRKMSIHSRNEIDISLDEIIRILNKKPGKWINELYLDLENKILHLKLKNDRENIKQYIINNY